MPGRLPEGEGKEHYRLLFERATDGIWLADREGRFVDMNPAACAMLGYAREEHLRLSVSDVIREEEAPRLRDLMRELAAGHQITDIWEIRRADGTYVSLELSHAFTPDSLWQAIGRDITERGRAEAALRESEERFAVEAADLGRWELVPETCNRHLGLPEDSRPTHEEHFQTIHPDDHAMIYERLRRAVEEEGEFEAEYRVIYPDGGVRRILSRARVLRSPGSAPDRLTGITLDVTEARELEEERERARARELTVLTEAAERERISRKLHDRVAHGLGVAHQSLELFSVLSQSDPERAQEKLALAKQTTRRALDQTRALSAELKRLQEEELAEGLDGAFGRLAGSYVPDGIEMAVSFSGEESAIPASVGMQAYLAVREAIRNALKHSGCSRVRSRSRFETGTSTA